MRSYNPKKKQAKPKPSTKGLGKDVLEFIASSPNPKRRRPSRRKKNLNPKQ